MKKVLLFFIVLVQGMSLHSQNMNGFVENNYSGVVGNRFNPANLADNKLKIDVSLLSTNINAVGENISYNLSDRQVSYGRNGKINTNLTLDFDIGVMASFGKFGIGFSARPKSFLMGSDVDPNVLDYIRDTENSSENFTLKNDNTNVLANVWNEYAFNFGMVVLDKGEHFIKAGAELKLMQGLGGLTFKANNLNLVFDNSNDLENIQGASGGASVLYSDGINTETLELPSIDNLGKFSLGYNFGVVYEWRPDAKTDTEDKINEYKIKVGVSILDIGKLKYTSGMHSSSFTLPVSNFDTSDIEGGGDLNIEELYNLIYVDGSKYFEAVDVEKEMEISLPTKLNIHVDYNIYGNWYVALVNSISLKKSNELFSLSEYSYFSVNPRYESRFLGFGAPISYRKVDGFHFGANVSFGVFYIGTSDVGAFVDLEKIDGGNLFMGLRIPV